MRVFARIVDLGSFTLAGQQLGMSAGAVTRSVGMLEAHLNMRLPNRTTRRLFMTDAGRLHLDGCRVVIEKLDEVESDLVRATRDPSSVLRIAAPSLFANGGLMPLLGAYREANPRVNFDVTAYDTHIDLIRYDVDGGMHDISIVYPGRRYLTMKVRSFIDFAVEHFRSDARSELPMPPSRTRMSHGSPAQAISLLDRSLQ